MFGHWGPPSGRRAEPLVPGVDLEIGEHLLPGESAVAFAAGEAPELRVGRGTSFLRGRGCV